MSEENKKSRAPDKSSTQGGSGRGGAKGPAKKRRRRRRRPGEGGESGGSAGQGQRSSRSGEASRRSSGEGQKRDDGRGQKRSRRRRPDGDRERRDGDRRGSRGGGRSRRSAPREGGSRTSTDASPSASAETAFDRAWQPPAISDTELESFASAPSVEDESASKQDATRWGDDSDAPTPDVELSPDLPLDPGADEVDPSTSALEAAGSSAALPNEKVANVVGIRFVPAGKIYLYDSGEQSYDKGQELVVDAGRSERLGRVAVASRRQKPPRSLKPVLRLATEEDRRLERGDEDKARELLTLAKQEAKKLRLSLKLFRAHREGSSERYSLYYSSEEKTDVRPLSRALSKATSIKVELRQTGVRDEAKMVGGIGSCGQELCCSTWLPAFVPVSIKNAKDQGLVLNPTKVSGQCGRLKCCLVYEQETYAEMRKGLPKLGKRVVTMDGLEGRVVEVDVLKQRIRVNVGRGEFKIYGRGEVKPMFASQPQGPGKQGKKKKKKPKGEGGASPKPRSNEEDSPNDDKN